MKYIIKTLTISLLITGATLISSSIYAQTDPPPPPETHGEAGNQPPGGGAPIGSGLFILLSLGAAYGGKKIYNYRKKKSEE